MIEVKVLKKMNKIDCFRNKGSRTSKYMELITNYLKERIGEAYGARELYSLLVLKKVEVGKSAPLTFSGFYTILKKVWAHNPLVHRKGNYYFYDNNYIKDIEDKKEYINKNKKK